MKLISFVYSHCVVFVSIRFQLGRRRINFLVSFQQNCSIWTRAEVAVYGLFFVEKTLGVLTNLTIQNLSLLMFSVARLSREMYNTFGLFVFGSFVNQLLTDTTKYTIGWL